MSRASSYFFCVCCLRHECLILFISRVARITDVFFLILKCAVEVFFLSLARSASAYESNNLSHSMITMKSVLALGKWYCSVERNNTVFNNLLAYIYVLYHLSSTVFLDTNRHTYNNFSEFPNRCFCASVGNYLIFLIHRSIDTCIPSPGILFNSKLNTYEHIFSLKVSLVYYRI